MGTINNISLQTTIDKIADLPGCFVEIGVLWGFTFKRIAAHAQRLGKQAHAFDSFEGMNHPGAKDDDAYPKGFLSIGGVSVFERIMLDTGMKRETYEIHQGWVPDCFIGFDQDISFALVDVDHYQPTLDSLRWLEERMVVGGIIVLDDWFPYKEMLASLAIKDWLKTVGDRWRVINELEDQIYIQRIHR